MQKIAENPQAAHRSGVLSLLTLLHNIKIGSSGAGCPSRAVSRRELIYMLNNLATLVKNGVSLPRALQTLARERSLKKHAPLLDAIRRKIEAGESFSSALAAFPATFDPLTIQQVRVGERSGTIAETLGRIAEQLETAHDLRSKILKRLSYPIILCIAGAGVVAFMLVYVVPQFEQTYQKARIPLPYITQLLMAAGNLALYYGWLAPLGVLAAAMAIKQARKKAPFAHRMDRTLLNLPFFGDWLRDIAVLQFMDVLGVMIQSGFKVVDALAVSIGPISNRAVRGAVEDLKAAVTRGERLSRELEKHGDLFPPVVSQLVIIGERTGGLGKATADIRAHLRRQIERKTDLLVATLEPTLTVVMAAAIGVILLAIYMPMFNMVEAVDSVGSGR